MGQLGANGLWGVSVSSRSFYHWDIAMTMPCCPGPGRAWCGLDKARTCASSGSGDCGRISCCAGGPWSTERILSVLWWGSVFVRKSRGVGREGLSTQPSVPTSWRVTSPPGSLCLFRERPQPSRMLGGCASREVLFCFWGDSLAAESAGFGGICGHTSAQKIVAHWTEELLLFGQSRVRLFAAPWTAARQAALSVGFSRQEHEWAAMPSSRGSSWLKDQTRVSCIGRWILYLLSHQGSPLMGGEAHVKWL